MKKFLGIFLAMMLVLSLSIATAFAAEGDDEGQTGSITVVNPTIDYAYAVYKVFDATYDADGNASYSYKADGTADAFLPVLQGDNSPFEATRVGDSDVYVITLKNGNTGADAIAAFLKANIDCLTQKENHTANSTDPFSFTGLDFGYYFVTTSLGTVISISNIDADVTIFDKNQAPGWEDPDGPNGDQQPGKNVSADGTNFAPTSTAGIGDTVFFKLTANAPLYNGKKLVTQYVFTDTVDSAFTLNIGSLVITANGETLDPDTDYDLTYDAQTNPNVFTVVFTVDANAQDGYAWEGDTHLVFTYNAVLNEAATPENENTASMNWYELTPSEEDPTIPGDPGETPSEPSTPPTDVTTETYTYGFNLIKVNEKNEGIDGAEFKLLDADGNEIALVAIDAEGFAYAYRVATAAEKAVEGFESAIIVAGDVKIFGLDKGEYAIEETKAPAGYNMLIEPQEFEISGDTAAGSVYVEVTVLNNAGTILPETGGVGTTIFYVIGGILVAGAIVLLITKKRLSKER